MSISAVISALGQNINFVAFNAHWGFAFAALILFPHVWFLPVAVGLAGLKEFWFDAKYEINPPQTFLDNLGDFSGYLAGLALAAWHLGWFKSFHF